MKKELPKIKKNIKAFLSSEEGKITKKKALEMGSGIIAIGMMLSQTGLTEAQSHFSSFANTATSGRHSSHSSHSSHGSHNSHNSHNSHSSHSSHDSHDAYP